MYPHSSHLLPTCPPNKTTNQINTKYFWKWTFPPFLHFFVIFELFCLLAWDYRQGYNFQKHYYYNSHTTAMSQAFVVYSIAVGAIITLKATV